MFTSVISAPLTSAGEGEGQAVSTFYDLDSTTTITTTPVPSFTDGRDSVSSSPGNTSFTSIPSSNNYSASATLTLSAKVGISIGVACSLGLILGPLLWFWRQRRGWKCSKCWRCGCLGLQWQRGTRDNGSGKRNRTGEKGPRRDALSSSKVEGVRRDALGDAEETADPALDGDDDEIYVNGRVRVERLGQYTIGMEPEDEIHRRQWEYKRVKRGRGARKVAELDGGHVVRRRAEVDEGGAGRGGGGISGAAGTVDARRRAFESMSRQRVFAGTWELDAGNDTKEGELSGQHDVALADKGEEEAEREDQQVDKGDDRRGEKAEVIPGMPECIPITPTEAAIMEGKKTDDE